MAVIRPFSCVRPAAEKAARIAALPYDVYNSEEARAEVEKNPDSFLKIDRAETQFPKGQNPYAEEVYKKAKELLESEIADGSYIRDERRCYYLYELTMDGRIQTGLAACASVDDYLNHIIKKHENTREEKELDRIRHVDMLSAQTGPIFLAYRKQEALSELFASVKQNEALYDFVSEDGIRHRVFVIDAQEQIEQIERTFSGIHEIYIADGHHRAASAVKVGQKRREAHPDYDGTEEFNYFLSVLFPDEELKIMDYNRVVKDLNGLEPEQFMDKMKELFLVEEIAGIGGVPASLTEMLSGEPPVEEGIVRPKKRGEFAMFFDGVWYRCDIDEAKRPADSVEGLDVSILQKQVLSPILGIEDPKTDKRIDFVGGIRGLAELERRCKEDCVLAFAMYPTSIQELFAVADAGKLMPPKSTWFEPKLRSGLFIHEIER